MLKLRSPASITIPKEKHRTIRPPFIFEFLKSVCDIFYGTKGHVGFSWGKVAEDVCTIDAFPEEGAVGEAVEVVPGDFDGDEVVDVGIFCDLRDLAAVAEGIRQEEDLRFEAEFVLEEMLVMKKLPSHRLSRWQVAIKLNPRSPHGLKSPFPNPFFQPLIKPRIILLEPPIMGSARRRKLIPLLLERLIHEVQLI